MDTLCDKPQTENEYGSLKVKNLLFFLDDNFL